MVNLGNKIRTLRLERHITQTELSRRIGVSKAMVSSYELEQRSPSYEVLIKIAAFFGVTTDFLLGLEKNRAISVEGLGVKELEIIAGMISVLKEK
ncbi:MAG: helix-turn-helix domain-containing protein [Oscillospiraceae bacterium]|nr:helix-turn-helix domain-containing protein [Oscillospiraceae bacterium]